MDRTSIDKFWNVVHEVSYVIKNNRKYLKVWVLYENLKEFANLLNLCFENYIENCILLENYVYMEMDDIDVERFIGFENVEDFIKEFEIGQY